MNSTSQGTQPRWQRRAQTVRSAKKGTGHHMRQKLKKWTVDTPDH